MSVMLWTNQNRAPIPGFLLFEHPKLPGAFHTGRVHRPYILRGQHNTSTTSTYNTSATYFVETVATTIAAVVLYCRFDRCDLDRSFDY